MLRVADEPIPINLDDAGVAKIGGTRVTLATVIHLFNRGATAEEIVQQYPTLPLADVYAVITYYLRQRDAVDAYLQEQAVKSAQVREAVEKRDDPSGIRERLLARRADD